MIPVLSEYLSWGIESTFDELTAVGVKLHLVQQSFMKENEEDIIKRKWVRQFQRQWFFADEDR